MNNGTREFINLSPEVQLRIPYSKAKEVSQLLLNPEAQRILQALNPEGYPLILTLSELAREVGIHKVIAQRRVKELELAGLVESHRVGKFRKIHLPGDFIPTEFRAVKQSIAKVARLEHSYEERILKESQSTTKQSLYRTFHPPYPVCRVRCSFCKGGQEARWDQGQKRCRSCGRMFWIRASDVIEGQHFRRLAQVVHLRCHSCQATVRSSTEKLRSRCSRCHRRIDVIPKYCGESLTAPTASGSSPPKHPKEAAVSGFVTTASASEVP